MCDAGETQVADTCARSNLSPCILHTRVFSRTHLLGIIIRGVWQPEKFVPSAAVGDLALIGSTVAWFILNFLLGDEHNI